MIRKYQILFLILLSYVVVLSFYPTITSDFINLDDPVMVIKNPDITSLSLNNIKHILSSYHYKLYHPIVTLSYAIEYSICTIEPYLYHVDNILLHLLNAFFVFFIIKFLSKSFVVGFISAFIFALHPAHVESVSWVSARKDTLYSFFFLLSILTYLRFNKIKHKPFLYVLSVVFFLLSCMSKPMAVILPIVLILIDFYEDKFRFKYDVLKKYIPFFFISFVFSYVAIFGHHSEQEKIISTLFAKTINFYDVHLNYLFYLYKFFLPIKLSCFYPSFYNHSGITPNFVFYSSTILYLLILLVVLSLKINKKVFFGFFFFVITLFPSSGILPTGLAPVADRYTYIPYIGLSFIVAELLCYIYKENKRLRYIIVLISLFIATSLVYLTYQRSLLWSDNKNLMTQAIDYAPEKADQAYLLRGMIYKSESELDLAEKDIVKSYSLNRDNACTIFHLAHLKQEQKKYLQAKEYYSLVPYTNTDYDVVLVQNIGLILDIEGNTRKAIDFMEGEKSRKAFFITDGFFNTLALLYYKENNIDKAIENMKQAVATNPLNGEYYIRLMTLYDENKDFINFKKIAFEGLKNSDNKTVILNKLSAHLFKKGKYDELKSLLISHFDLFNDFSYFLLGNVFAINANYKKALTCYTMSIMLHRNNGEYYFKRAVVWYMLNKYDLAQKDVERAQKYNFIVDKDFKEKLERV